MEPQTALALPDEDNCVKVFSSSQAPEYVHSVIATCLGIPEHNVRVITRRVGGGFGGKAIKSMPVSLFFNTNRFAAEAWFQAGGITGIRFSVPGLLVFWF